MDSQAIKELREATGLSFGDIKKALDEAGGDREKALELLKSRGVAIAQKKAERSTHEGIIESYVHTNKKIGVLVELVCETDFVARNPLFGELAHECALQIAAMAPTDIAEFLGGEYVKDPSITMSTLITNAIAKLGENIKVNRFERFSI